LGVLDRFDRAGQDRFDDVPVHVGELEFLEAGVEAAADLEAESGVFATLGGLRPRNLRRAGRVPARSWGRFLSVSCDVIAN
jgi:hypothetical protein